MWIKSKENKLKEYKIDVTTQRKMADDEHIMHMELADNPEFFISVRFDAEVKLFTNEEMDMLTSDAEGNELDAVALATKESEITSARSGDIKDTIKT